MGSSRSMASVVVLTALTIFIFGQCGPCDPNCPPQTARLTVQTTGEGNVVCDPEGNVYDSGTAVTLLATPESGWAFDHWLPSGSTANPVTMTMSSDLTITAVFVQASLACEDAEEWTTTAIASNTTIPAGCYRVESNLTVQNNAVLTISPGVTLQFAEDTALYIQAGGALYAAGSQTSPIVLTGQIQTPGSWGGVRFRDSNSTNNVLEYVTIEWGGQYLSGYGEANLGIKGFSRVSVSHCTLSDSSSYGFDFYDTPVITFDANTVTRNQLGAGRLYTARLAGVLTDTSTYTGNEVDVVEIGYGATSGSTGVDQTWDDLGAEYRIRGWCTVDSHLTIAPGARVVFYENAAMLVIATGSLTAQGTADEPIVLTGHAHTRGYWCGLRFEDSNSTDNVLDYVTIEWGGELVSGRGMAALGVVGNSRVSITHCTLSDSSSYGFDFYDTPVITFDANTVTRNQLGAGRLDAARLAGVLTDTSTYTGNEVDVVEIGYGATSGSTGVDQTWDDLGAEYRIRGWCTVDSHLTIAPGARVVFYENAAMLVIATGSLTAQGTADEPIALTGHAHTRGYWSGLRFEDSDSEDNILQYVSVEYAGQHLSGRGPICAVGAVGYAQVEVHNCTIQHNDGWGLAIGEYASVLRADNYFADNTLGDVYLEP